MGKNKKHRHSYLEAKRAAAKKQAKLAAFQKNIAIISLLVILAIGLVSTSFASYITPDTSTTGELIADVQSVAVTQRNKTDIADTGANVDLAGTGYNISESTTFYFDNTSAGFDSACIQLMVGKSDYSRGYEMEHIPNTNIYYVVMPKWDGCTQLCIFGTSNEWAGENNNISHRKNYADESTGILNLTENPSGTRWLSGSSTLSYSTSVTLNYNQNIYIRSAAHNSTTFSNDANAGTVSVTGYAISSNSTTAYSGTTTSYNLTASVGRTTQVSMTATAKAGYDFVGWYTSTSSTAAAVATTSTYSYTVTGSKTIYARFKKQTPFAIGDTIYFDCRSANGWATTTPSVQLSSATTSSSKYQMTQIGTYLYKYTFTSTTATSAVVRFWGGTSGTNYTNTLTKADYDSSSAKNGIFSTSSVTNGSGTAYKFTLDSITTPTLTLSAEDIVLGESVTLTSSQGVLNYTRGTTKYTTIPTGAVYTFKADTTSLSANGNYSYSWTPTVCGEYDITVGITSSNSGLTSSTTAAQTVTVRPADPENLRLTASDTLSGSGTSADPYIVYSSSSFNVTADIDAPVTAGAAKHFSNSASSGYSTTNVFTPAISSTGTQLSLNVYAKTYSNGIYSENYVNDSVYYMSFTRINGANTGMTLSSNNIEENKSLTLSNKYINGISSTEKAYITQTYQVSSDNSTFTDLSSDATYVWEPSSMGTFYFRLKTVNIKTGDEVYSASKSVSVTECTDKYNITVVKNGNATATFDFYAVRYGTQTAITAGTEKIQHNYALRVVLNRPNSNYYVKSLTVTAENTSGKDGYTNYNGNIDYTAIDLVKGNVTVTYELALKPTVTVSKPSNTQAVKFTYYKDGTATDVTTAGTYYVDYNSDIKYTVNPASGYYVSDFTGVELASDSNWSSTESIGVATDVIDNISPVTATIEKNKSIKVNIDSISAVTDGAALHVGGQQYQFAEEVPLGYNVSTQVVITPPEGHYAQVTTTSGVAVTPSIGTDGKATFNVALTNTSSVYLVKFIANPKIYITQPQYGSIYIDDGTGRYLFNGESVGYGTQLTVNVKVDNQSNTLTAVKINGASIGTTDGSKFNITEDSTATADISITNGYDAFEEPLAYGYRRIFFTDSLGWGNDVTAHASNTYNDRNFNTNNFGMTYLYTNTNYSQNVYYCDIPFDKKYVVFFDNGTQSRYTATATITNDYNAYYAKSGSSPFPIDMWTQYYSDFVATDRAESIQQARTTKNQPVIFKYSCDYGDGILSAQVVDGNACTVEFDNGELIITPTEIQHDFSLIKVTSAITQTVKYYLISVETFEISEFSGIRKIYNSAIINNIQLQTILNGGVLDFIAEYSISDTNGSNTYRSIGSANGFNYSDTLAGYVNNFTLNYSAGTIKGVKFYKVTAQDGSGKTATAYQRTLFGTNYYTGERSMYIYNSTNIDISKYDLRLCFYNDDGNYIWSTMQPVGVTGYYRATIPQGYDQTVNIYLARKDKFTTNVEDMKLAEFCAYGVTGAPIPAENTSEIVYSVYAINAEGISGEFVNFN